ncbi:MAG: methyl-accepting chemotaxis protein [Treponema sp.]|jgi:methyl-accepting chemotaxis protein|nr:methyl-accepting chemotaxis protein [Treponema sp.]
MMVLTADRIRQEERNGELVINYFRISSAVLCGIGIAVISFLRHRSGYDGAAPIVYSGPVVFLIYSIGVFWYLHKHAMIPSSLKYLFMILDIGLIAYTVFIIGSHFSALPPLTVVTFQVSFYFVFIMLGTLRYSSICALFSGIIAMVAYGTVTFMLNRSLHVADGLRGVFLIIGGIITALILKQSQQLLRSVLDADIISDSADAALKTVMQTKEVATTIRELTTEISRSSKEIFTTANSQATSVEEIVSTINENAKIATDIADKTGSVATIAAKMEDDVITGFSVLENNVKKMGDIKEKNDGVINGIVLLGYKITKIRDIVRVINTITDQTKVIAFNAALEAAGAGETGKRFAVVAGEVNRLADDIANLTKQIKEQVEAIQESSSSLIISSEEGADKIAEGYKLIKNLENIFKEVRSGAEITSNQAQTITIATQKQRKSSEQIHSAISDISRGLNSFLHSTEVATSSAEKLTELACTLELTLNGEFDMDAAGD